MKETVEIKENKSERDDVINFMSKKTRIGVAPPAYEMNRFEQINKQTNE